MTPNLADWLRPLDDEDTTDEETVEVELVWIAQD